MITVIDYKCGNINSIINLFKRIDISVNFSRNIDNADAIVLPGVGTFSSVMSSIGDLANDIKKFDRPILGICVGMQILFESGCEIKYCDGLGLLEGRVIRIPTANRLPHIGWNTLEFLQKDVYFMNSYMVDENKYTLDYVFYGNIKIPAIVKNNKITGFQFHPEKSGKVGEKILKEWVLSWEL